MISRLVGIRSAASLSINRINHVRNHVPMRFPAGTYDELALPQGSWEELNRKRNAYYNQVLLISSAILVLVSSVAIYVSHVNKYSLPKADNSEEGLKFLNPDPKALEYVLEN